MIPHGQDLPSGVEAVDFSPAADAVPASAVTEAPTAIARGRPLHLRLRVLRI
ncbi:MAG: hypothetical protein HYY17_14085 [Planctomycetes bacterium]|nr:hypothetical protein [Planctomycetota bacterium]